MKKQILFFLFFFLILCAPSIFGQKKITISVLKVGTVNWLLEAIRQNGLDKKYGFSMEVEKLANPQATTLSMKSGSADIAVSDWIWISNQRNRGNNFMYMPYSSTIGSLMVNEKAGIRKLTDLEGKKLGIVGGPNDKGWLLIRAIAAKKYGVKIDNKVEKFFGSPPLLKQKIKKGELDAIIIYWHHASELESLGFKKLFPLEKLYDELGFQSPVPILGFVFREEWANKNRDLLVSFRKAYREAQTLIQSDRSKWEDLKPVIKPKNKQHNEILYNEFVKGIPKDFKKSDIQTAQKLYQIFYKYGDKKSFGNKDRIDESLFYF